jgi:MFS superfamily sulfate permease-like transporter
MNNIHPSNDGAICNQPEQEIPEDGLTGLRRYWKTDMLSGLIVFLIALPLCLGIAIASGVPPMAGIFSAVVGGILVSQLGGSYVTINGPAAGLIVVILASVDRLGGGAIGYHATLAAIVVSGALLFIMGMCKAGKLGDLFPSNVVHGLLAAIGIIIMAKQLPFVLGVQPPAKEPLEIIEHIPQMFQHLNPEIATVGFVSLAILIAHGSITNKLLRRVPAPIIVVVVSILLANYLDLGHTHTDIIGGVPVNITPKFLVSLPSSVMNAVAIPSFSQAGSCAFVLSVISITLVQFIESLLSAAAVEKLDPFRRPVNLSRDITAVGIGSAIAGMIGGLPVIAEIVRSTANVSNGARTRWANFFHGVFMLTAVVFCAAQINKIPLAALAALLVFTGYRLASPRVFKEARSAGLDQLFIFCATIVATLTTDLLIGVGVGIVFKMLLHIFRGVPVSSLFKANLVLDESDADNTIVHVKDCAIFSNYLSLKGQLAKLSDKRSIVVDLSMAKLVDHTMFERLHAFSEEQFRAHGTKIHVSGLQLHRAASNHPFAARRLISRSERERKAH